MSHSFAIITDCHNYIRMYYFVSCMVNNSQLSTLVKSGFIIKTVGTQKLEANEAVKLYHYHTMY